MQDDESQPLLQTSFPDPDDLDEENALSPGKKLVCGAYIDSNNELF